MSIPVVMTLELIWSAIHLHLVGETLKNRARAPLRWTRDRARIGKLSGAPHRIFRFVQGL